MNKDNILEVKNVHKRFHSKGITVKAVSGFKNRDCCIFGNYRGEQPSVKIGAVTQP